MKPAVLVCLLTFAFGATALAQTPPRQPTSGPGGNNYAHATVTINGPYWAQGHANDNNYRYFIFEPGTPTPKTRPVVLFLHSFLANDPSQFAFLIGHIVRKGYVVVWVQYQDGVIPTWRYISNAETAWLDALNRLATNYSEPHVRPAVDAAGRLETAVVGHSAGAYLAVILAARATRPFSRDPKPFAVIAFEPAGKGLIPGEDFTRIDPSTKLLLVTGDQDDIACTVTPTAVWANTSQIPDANRDLLLVRSDSHGSPAQLGNHYFPNTSGALDTAAVDARDFYVTFKLSVATLNCAFSGQDCTVALGEGQEAQITMGAWSDGVPVVPLEWLYDASLIPVIPACVGK